VTGGEAKGEPVSGGRPQRYLTRDLPGIGGALKERYEDFVVEELPLYAPSGEGEHTFFEIQKTGLSTFEALRRIARALDVSATVWAMPGSRMRGP